MLDANILIRATLGELVRRILETHAENIFFFVPDAAYSEAEEHLAALVVKRGGDPTKALRVLKAMAAITTMVGNEDVHHLFRWRYCMPAMCHLLQWLTFALAGSKKPGAAT